MGWLAWLQETDWASGLRGSLWLYPAISALHVLGIALLLGPILVHHAAVLGVAFAAQRAALVEALPRVAGLGLALAAASGALLWSARPHEYALHPVFQTKMVLVLIAAVNVAVVRGLARSGGAKRGRGLRVGALVSAAAWLAVLLAGRLIGYR